MFLDNKYEEASMEFTKKVRALDHRLRTFSENENLFIFFQSSDSQILDRLNITANDAPYSFVPPAIGKETLKNAEGFVKVRKDLEKEEVYRTIYREWLFKDWHGNEHYASGIYNIPYMAYPREKIIPRELSINFFRENNNNVFYIGPLELQQPDAIKDAINIMIEIFNFCTLTSDINNRIENLQRLPWKILPQGEMPWQGTEGILRTLRGIRSSRIISESVLQSRFQFLEEFGPTFRAIGQDGFSGYHILGYRDKNLFILESAFQDNATYIFENNWEILSRLTKAEILSNSLQKYRVIHTPSWRNEISTILS